MSRFPSVMCSSAALILIAVCGPASADELYRQNATNNVGGLSSQDARNPGGLGWFSEVADNFPGVAGWRIDRVEFWGGYVQPPSSPGNTEGFTIRFYTDDNGRPGTRVFELDVFLFSEVVYYIHPAGWAGYVYSVDLATPFEIPAGGQYWVSVVAILARGGTATEPQWGWVQAQVATPPFAHQWFFSPGNFTQQTNDVGFVLHGSAGGPLRGDLNCDGAVNVLDVPAFALALADPAGYAATYPMCDIRRADMNGDGREDGEDVPGFVAAVLGP